MVAGAQWNSITLLEGIGRALSSKIASTSPDSALEGVISSGGKTLREAIRLPSPRITPVNLLNRRR
jgi:hypothetical protein